MKKPRPMRITLAAGVLLLTAITALAQPSSQPQSQQPSFELYHIHFAKAAPGKLPQLIEAYKSGPAPEANEPQFNPIMLRHREGGEWDVIVITPLGRQTTISAEAPAQAIQDFNQRVAPLTDWHSDTFVLGPSWAVVQKALIVAKGEPVYIVSDYRSLPGHRAQLRQTLDRLGGESADRYLLFAHVEGAPWNFLGITRYDSWAEMGAPPPQPAAGAAAQEPGLVLREHLAVHHDTIAVYVSGGQAIRR